MDRELAPTLQRRRVWRRWLLVLLLLTGGGAALVAFRAALRPHLTRAQISTARVETGAVEATLSAGGTVVPGREVVLTAPIASTIEQVLQPVGTAVRAGEPLLLLDTEATATALGKLRDEQARQANKTQQLTLTLERALTDFETQRAAQQARVASLQAAVRDEQYLLGVGGTTAEAVRQAQLSLQVGELELRRLTNQISTQRRTSAADQREVGFQQASQTRDVAELERKLRQAAISPDQPGVLTWINDNLGAPVAPGAELARVADLSSFRIRATISDSYADALHIGDAVRVRLGNGTADLNGLIQTISPAVDKGNVTFFVTLTDAAAAKAALRANLRVDVFVVTRNHPRTLRLPNGPYFRGGREQTVYVVAPDGRTASRRTVQLGDSNFDWVQVVSGLQPGETVVTTNTKDLDEAPLVGLSD